MKLPIDFGTKLFFRIVLPGLVLAALLSRLSYGLAAHLGFTGVWPYIFTVEVLAFGLIFVALDMPIYMLFEGRRFWPAWLRQSLIAFERARLLRLHRTIRSPRASVGTSRIRAIEARRQKLEALVEISYFPLHEKTFQPEVVWPTRLGNMIAAFEQHSRLKYGLDAIFFWPRIWIAIDQSLREEIDNQQALPDGLLYCVVAVVLGALALVPSAILDYWHPGFLPSPVDWIWDILAIAPLLAIAIVLYRLSLFPHAQFGEVFKALIDQHRSKLDMEATVELVADVSGDRRLPKRSEFERNMAVWRYLKWHRVRPHGETRNRRARTP